MLGFWIFGIYLLTLSSTKSVEKNATVNDTLASPSSDGKITLTSELRDIAQGSAKNAENAAENQFTAAKQAELLAKNSLAQSAANSAATAHTALLGKKVILEKLKRDIERARGVVEREAEQLEQVQRSANISQETAEAAHAQVDAIITVLKIAQTTATHAFEAAQLSSSGLAAQTSMLTNAKQKLSDLTRELQAVEIDFKATQEAAEKAAAAAIVAKTNANQTVSLEHK